MSEEFVCKIVSRRCRPTLVAYVRNRGHQRIYVWKVGQSLSNVDAVCTTYFTCLATLNCVYLIGFKLQVKTFLMQNGSTSTGEGKCFGNSLVKRVLFLLVSYNMSSPFNCSLLNPLITQLFGLNSFHNYCLSFCTTSFPT